MRNLFTRTLRRTAAAAALTLTALTATAQKQEVHILSTNDMHATIDAFPQLAAIADSLRELYPSLLVFSAGDNRTGNPLNDKNEIPAYPMVALMNQVGFNASTLGNHEFDVKSLPRLTGLSNFRYVCANVFPDSASGIRLVPCQTFDVEGLKISVVGAIQLNKGGIPSTHPDNVRGVAFKPAREVLGAYEWLSRNSEATILLSHLGYDEDLRVAEEFPWFDLIIGGHTHTQLTADEPLHNGVLITQNKNKLPQATHITLTFEDGRVVSKKAEYINVKAFARKNKTVEAMVKYFSENPEFQRILAQAEAPFSNKEELGCMMCDAYMTEFNADMAVENPGGVRLDSHPAGDITVLDVLEMDPFDNNAVVLNLTGDELLEMMLTYCQLKRYSFPFVGGFRCEITVEKGNQKKIKSVRLLTLDGKPLNMKRKYRVVTNNYVSAVGKVPPGAARQTNNQTTDLIMDFLVKQGSVNYHGVKRLEVKEAEE